MPRLPTLQETDQRQIGAVEHHVGAEGWRAEPKMIVDTPGELLLKAMPLIAVNRISGTRHDASAAWNRTLIDTTSVGMMHTFGAAQITACTEAGGTFESAQLTAANDRASQGSTTAPTARSYSTRSSKWRFDCVVQSTITMRRGRRLG